MRYRPQSIQEVGLETYLSQTYSRHKGLGWDDFKQRMALGVPKARIAQDFGISPQTAWKWVKIYEKQSHDES